MQCYLVLGLIALNVRTRAAAPPAKFGDQVDPDVRHRRQAHDRDADRHGGVERAAGDRAHRIGAGEHGEADRQSVGGIAARAFRRGHVQHDVAERERVEEFRDERARHVGHHRLHRGIALHEQHDGGGRRGAEDLRDPVGHDVGGRAAAADEHRERDRRIVVRARDVAAGEDHHHQRGADRERRQIARRRARSP